MPHLHFQCLECNEIQDIFLDECDNEKLNEKLKEFASFTREVLDNIKTSSAYNEILVHMAMPVACAFMLGHVWMPKADMKLILHDYYNNTENKAIIIE